MNGTPNQDPPKKQLLMLIETAPGELTLMDNGGIKHVSKGADEFWATACRLLKHGDAPALTSGPAPGRKGNGVTIKAEKADKDAEKQKLGNAFGTLGRRLQDVAEAEFGAPIVSAAATIASQATKKASGIAARHSRKGLGRRWSLRKRAARS